MRNSVEIQPAAQSIVAALGRFPLPIELDRVRLFGRSRKRGEQLCFRFGFRDVPFKCVAERRDGLPYLTLSGDLGGLACTPTTPARRRSVQTIVAAAAQRSGLLWTISPRQQVEVSGALTLDGPLTGASLVTGAVTLLMRARPYLDLLVDTLRQPEADRVGLNPAARQPLAPDR